MVQLATLFGENHAPSYWRERFNAWEKPPSDSEESRIDATIKAIKSALQKSEQLSQLDLRIFGQGSYQNNTNVRLNSDVDICVLCANVVHPIVITDDIVTLAELGLLPLEEPLENFFARYKDAIQSALNSEFGWFDINRGNKSIQINSDRDIIVNADVVPAIPHWRVYGRHAWREGQPIKDAGILIIPDDESCVINFPEQHYANGVDKNKRTRRRYKQVVRILKRLQARIVDDQLFYTPVPSFLIECLAFNCRDTLFDSEDMFEIVVNVLRDIEFMTINDLMASGLLEVNCFKPLFASDQRWRRSEANLFARVAIETIGV